MCFAPGPAGWGNPVNTFLLLRKPIQFLPPHLISDFKGSFSNSTSSISFHDDIRYLSLSCNWSFIHFHTSNTILPSTYVLFLPFLALALIAEDDSQQAASPFCLHSLCCVSWCFFWCFCWNSRSTKNVFWFFKLPWYVTIWNCLQQNVLELVPSQL